MCFIFCFIFSLTMLQLLQGITGKLFRWVLQKIIFNSMEVVYHQRKLWKFCSCVLRKKRKLLNQEHNIQNFGKSKICSNFLLWVQCSWTWIIKKSVIFYMIGIYMSTFTLNESIYVVMNLKLYFGMPSLYLNIFRV
jgi:hypothetical protein